MRLVVDTNIFVSAIMNAAGSPRQLLRLCLEGQMVPLMGNALFNEYEAVLARPALFENRPVSMKEIETLFDAFMSVCVWTPVYFLLRPNLPDEADNHLLELAVAGNARAIATANKRDLLGGQLHFPEIAVGTASEILELKELEEWRR